jgi:predicted  nucleic acid-binding Zn-ribbon protein
MEWNLETIKFIGGVLLALGSAAYTWIATRDKDNSQHIKAVEKALGEEIAKHGNRLQTLESAQKHLVGQQEFGRLEKEMEKVQTTLKHMPTQDEIAELQGDMKAVKATQEGMRVELQTARRSLERIEDFLLNGGGSK